MITGIHAPKILNGQDKEFWRKNDGYVVKCHEKAICPKKYPSNDN